MENIQIFKNLTPILRTTFQNELLVLTNELSAKDLENWDSLTHMLLKTEIEKSFSIKFKLKELSKMRNVGEIVDVIKSKL